MIKAIYSNSIRIVLALSIAFVGMPKSFAETNNTVDTSQLDLNLANMQNEILKNPEVVLKKLSTTKVFALSLRSN